MGRLKVAPRGASACDCQCASGTRSPQSLTHCNLSVTSSHPCSHRYTSHPAAYTVFLTLSALPRTRAAVRSGLGRWFRWLLVREGSHFDHPARALGQAEVDGCLACYGKRSVVVGLKNKPKCQALGTEPQNRESLDFRSIVSDDEVVIWWDRDRSWEAVGATGRIGLKVWLLRLAVADHAPVFDLQRVARVLDNSLDERREHFRGVGVEYAADVPAPCSELPQVGPCSAPGGE